MVYPLKDNESLWLANHAMPNDSKARYACRIILLFAEQLAQIYPNISDVNIGQMRCAWWQDKIAPDNAPIVTTPFASKLPEDMSAFLHELRQVMGHYALSPKWFEGLIHYRAREFTDMPLQTEVDFYDYAGGIAGNLFALWAEIIAFSKNITLPKLDAPFWHLLHHSAEIHTIARLMRTVYWQSQPSNAHSGMAGQTAHHNTIGRRGMLFLPQTLLQQHGLDATTPIEALQSPNMKEALAQLHHDASARHHHALQQLKDDDETYILCKNLSSLFYFSPFSELCLQHFAKHKYDYLNPRAIATPLFLPLQLRLKKRIF